MTSALSIRAASLLLGCAALSAASWAGDGARRTWDFEFDGKKCLEVDDATFPDAGRIGLWSKSEARSYFDDLTVSSTE